MQYEHLKVLGKVRLPDCENDVWMVDSHKLTDDMIGLSNLRYLRDGNSEMVVRVGTYKRLIHKKQGLVMSNTQMEIRTNRNFVDRAKGDVLVLGLGLGMVLEPLLLSPDITTVTVIEISQDLIDLVSPHFDDPRLTIICADALTWKPPKGARYGAVWCDIWPNISADNHDQMKMLSRRYNKRISEWTGCWSREMVEREIRRSKQGWW